MMPNSPARTVLPRLRMPTLFRRLHPRRSRRRHHPASRVPALRKANYNMGERHRRWRIAAIYLLMKIPPH